MNDLVMPKIDRKLIARKIDIVNDFKKIIKSENVLYHEDETRPFETDALTAYKQKPLIVIFPENTKEVSKILSYCNQHRIKVVPRGAGTGLSGGALPMADSVMQPIFPVAINSGLILSIFNILFSNNFFAISF